MARSGFIFSNNYFVVTYDLRGYGRSTYSENKFSHANDLRKLLQHLNLDKIYLVGCSFACQIIIDFVLEYPDLVLSLTLINGHPFGFKKEPIDIHPLAHVSELEYDQKNIDELAEIETLIWFVGRKRSKNNVNQAIFRKIVEMDRIALKNEIHNPPNEIKIHPNAMEELNEIKSPISFIVGSLDEPNMNYACESLAEELKSPINYITNTAHFPNMEKPEEFNSILLNIIQ